MNESQFIKWYTEMYPRGLAYLMANGVPRHDIASLKSVGPIGKPIMGADHRTVDVLYSVWKKLQRKPDMEPEDCEYYFWKALVNQRKRFWQEVKKAQKAKKAQKPDDEADDDDDSFSDIEDIEDGNTVEGRLEAYESISSALFAIEEKMLKMENPYREVLELSFDFWTPVEMEAAWKEGKKLREWTPGINKQPKRIYALKYKAIDILRERLKESALENINVINEILDTLRMRRRQEK